MPPSFFKYCVVIKSHNQAHMWQYVKTKLPVLLLYPSGGISGVKII